MSLDLQAIREHAKRRLFNGHATHAEEDRDALLAEVERLTARLDRVRERCEAYEGDDESSGLRHDVLEALDGEATDGLG